MSHTILLTGMQQETKGLRKFDSQESGGLNLFFLPVGELVSPSQQWQHLGFQSWVPQGLTCDNRNRREATIPEPLSSCFLLGASLQSAQPCLRTALHRNLFLLVPLLVACQFSWPNFTFFTKILAQSCLLPTDPAASHASQVDKNKYVDKPQFPCPPDT